MLRYALRNLLQGKARLAVSLGGVALAFTLIFSFDAIVEGAQRRLTAYMRESGADVFVSQAGVRNMHMATSTLPAAVVDELRGQPDIDSVTPILYLSNMVEVGEGRHAAYIIGLPADAVMGGPWRVAAGKSIPGRGEAIIDRAVAEDAGVGIGDRVKVLGHEFTISGLAGGTANFTNSIAFVSFEDFAQLRGGPPVVSYVLVKVTPGASPEAVAARLEASIPGTTAQTRDAFARAERGLVNDMMTDVSSIMNLVGFMIGLAVMALTVYIATFSRRAEHGTLKAIGAGNVHLYVAVVAQALSIVAAGFLLGLVLTLLLAVVVPLASPNISLAISAPSMLKAVGVSLVIAALSAALPIRQIASLDPAVVFKGGTG